MKRTTLVSVMTAFELVVGMATRISGRNKVAVGFLGLASGILALVGVMAVLGAINPGVIAKGVTNLVLITGLLAAIEIVMGLASRVKGEIKAHANILKVTTTLDAMVGLIKIISFFTPEELKQVIFTLIRMVTNIAASDLFSCKSA